MRLNFGKVKNSLIHLSLKYPDGLKRTAFFACIPNYVAPNLITLLGFFLILLSYFEISYYNVSMTNDHVPNWVFLLAAICFFIYQQLDGLDGMQARRTTTSSPLGELFDHGCDAITAGVGVMLICSEINLGATYYSLYLILAVGFLFFMVHWEEDETGILAFGYVNAPTEGQLAMELSFLLTFFCGQKFWMQPLVNLMPSFLPLTFTNFIIGLSITQAIYYFGLFLAFCSAISSLFTAVSSVYARNGSFLLLFIQLVPITVLAASTGLWLYIAPHILQYLWYIGTAYSLIAAYLTGCLVIGRVCKERFYFSVIPFVFTVALLNSALPKVITQIIKTPLIDEVNMIWIVLGISILNHIVFVYSVVNQLANHLNIHVLTIPHRKIA